MCPESRGWEGLAQKGADESGTRDRECSGQGGPVEGRARDLEALKDSQGDCNREPGSLGGTRSHRRGQDFGDHVQEFGLCSESRGCLGGLQLTG